MDAIEALDWGAYADFRHQVSHHPEVLPIMQVAYYVSDYVAIGVLFSLAATLFLLQGKHRSAQLTAVSLAFAVTLIFGVRYLVPRLRPPDAQNWLGTHDLGGSYPSMGVFLFMLAMILVGSALWGLFDRIWLRALFAAVATLLTVWVCLSQLYLATNFLTDILGGLAGATLVWWLARKLLDRPALAPPGADRLLPE